MESVGVDVVNAQPGRGDLRPLRGRREVATVPDSTQQLTIYRMGRGLTSDTDYWLSWPDRVSVVLGQDGDGTTERTYFSGSGAPKWTDNTMAFSGGPPYPQASRPLGIPAPITAPSVAVSVEGTGTEAIRNYVYTYVNSMGWESAPSPLSSDLLCKGGSTVGITGLASPPSGGYDITAIRVYRTQSGTNGDGDFYFLREIAVATSTTDDDRALGDLMATQGWLPPPDDMTGLCGMWNGMMAGISGKTLMFCEPYSPYAWPVKYDIESRDQPVALGVWQQNLLVLTNGAPVLITGSSPDGLDQTTLPLVAPCLSVAGVVSFGHGVVWPSADGLAYSGAGDVVTRALLIEDQWRALNPFTMVAGRAGRFYACTYEVEAGKRGFLIDPANPGGGIWWLSSGWDACWYDELQDKLFVLSGGSVQWFDCPLEDYLTARFESKHFAQPAPINYGWCKVVASGFPLICSFYADGPDGVMSLRYTRSVTSSAPFALPSGFTSENWQIVVESEHDVQAVRLATSMAELKAP